MDPFERLAGQDTGVTCGSFQDFLFEPEPAGQDIGVMHESLNEDFFFELESAGQIQDPDVDPSLYNFFDDLPLGQDTLPPLEKGLENLSEDEHPTTGGKTVKPYKTLWSPGSSVDSDDESEQIDKLKSCGSVSFQTGDEAPNTDEGQEHEDNGVLRDRTQPDNLQAGLVDINDTDRIFSAPFNTLNQQEKRHLILHYLNEDQDFFKMVCESFNTNDVVEDGLANDGLVEDGVDVERADEGDNDGDSVGEESVGEDCGDEDCGDEDCGDEDCGDEDCGDEDCGDEHSDDEDEVDDNDDDSDFDEKEDDDDDDTDDGDYDDHSVSKTKGSKDTQSRKPSSGSSHYSTSSQKFPRKGITASRKAPAVATSSAPHTIEYPAPAEAMTKDDAKSHGSREWSLREQDCGIKHMLDIRDEGTLRGERRFGEAARRVSQQMGTARTQTSFKNFWNRVGRARSGFDERRRQTAPLATSQQGKDVERKRRLAQSERDKELAAREPGRGKRVKYTL